jgi:peptidoglycan/xylan/chitin deacetylase (PgdA/CDA1 family)
MGELCKLFRRGLFALTALLPIWSCTTVSTPGTEAAKPTALADTFESDEFIVVLAKAGDTPQSLAAKFLGDASRDWMIEDYNGSANFTVGQQIVIPKRSWNISGVDSSGFQLVPILVYHNLAPQPKGRMVIAAKTFEEQMRYLKTQGFRVVSLKEFLEFASLQRQLPRKSLVLTFDDGYKSFLQYAYPVLKELGFNATLFVYTDYIGTGGNSLSWADLKKLAAEGFQIEAHSKSHADLRRAAGEPANEYAKRLSIELNQPRELFLKNLGHYPSILAYPFGYQDDGVTQKTKEAGYAAAFTVRRQGNPSFVEPLRIHRSQIYAAMTLEEFIKNLNFFNVQGLQ